MATTKFSPGQIVIGTFMLAAFLDSGWALAHSRTGPK